MTKDDDPQLLRDLRNLAADYEPDVAAISRRVRNLEATDLVGSGPFIVPLGSLGPDPFGPAGLGSPGSAGSAGSTGSAGPADRLRLVPDAGSSPSVLRPGRTLLLPAAAVLVLFGGVVLAGSLGRPDPEPTATAVPIATAVATTPPTAFQTTPAPSPTRSRSAAGTPSSDRNSTAPATSTAPTGTATTGEATSQVTVSVRPAVEAGTAVNLSRPPLTDWLAVGTRGDLKQVRPKTGTGVLSLDQPGSASSVDGPFTVSWTAGLPEQSHDDAVRWLMADGTTGLTVTVSGSSEPRTVMLYAGTQDLRGSISFSGKDIRTDRSTLGPVSAGPQGVVITASLPATTAPTRISLTGTPDGPSPKVYLAAITLSP